MTATVENEAELQARLEARIRAAFPLLPAQIKLEHNLHLKIGHHIISLDGKKSTADVIRGRYDVLVLSDNKPLLLAELKATDVELTEDDLAQALSYARNHQPMVPLVLVANGKVAVVRRTYDGTPVDTAAGATLTSILESAATLAAADSENAVRTLLASSKDTWQQLFAQWTDEALLSMTGGVRDINRPIVRGASIPREAAQRVSSHLLAGSRIVVLHGPPLAGVTNVLAQIAQDRSLSQALFVDAAATPDVLQSIANRLSRGLSFGISKDDIRSWLNTGCGPSGMVIVLDGLPREGAEELIEYAQSGLLRLVLGTDSETHRSASTRSGRSQQSLLGRSHLAIELKCLSDKEFLDALEVLDGSAGVRFFSGVQYSQELRWPRTLRVLVASLPQRKPTSGAGGRDTRRMLSPISGPELLELCGRAFASEPKLKSDLRRLALAFLADAAEHFEDPGWLGAAWGRPSIDPDVIEEMLGEQRVERLCRSGFISWGNAKFFGTRLFVRVEELLAHHVAEEWSEVLAKLKGKDALIAELERLVRLSAAVPLGDVSLAAAIARASRKNPLTLGRSVKYLMQDMPIASTLGEGARVDLLTKDGPIHLEFGEGMDEEVFGNTRSWIVLSHLVAAPMKVEESDVTVNFEIFLKLGCWSDFLCEPRPTEFQNVPAFLFHDIEGIGSVPCFHMGIVESLLHAMLMHVHAFPAEFVGLAEFAKECKEFHLAWRLLTVAMFAETSTDKAVSEAAQQVEGLLREWWGNSVMDAMMHRDESSEATPPDPLETDSATSFVHAAAPVVSEDDASHAGSAAASVAGSPDDGSPANLTAVIKGANGAGDELAGAVAVPLASPGTALAQGVTIPPAVGNGCTSANDVAPTSLASRNDDASDDTSQQEVGPDSPSRRG